MAVHPNDIPLFVQMESSGDLVTSSIGVVAVLLEVLTYTRGLLPRFIGGSCCHRRNLASLRFPWPFPDDDPEI